MIFMKIKEWGGLGQGEGGTTEKDRVRCNGKREEKIKKDKN